MGKRGELGEIGPDVILQYSLALIAEFLWPWGKPRNVVYKFPLVPY